MGTMVANLSAHKRGWYDRWEEFSDWAVKGQELKKELLSLVDEDTAAFNRIMEAFGLPKNTDEEKAKRKQAIQNATKYAIEIPFKVMEKALASLEVCAKMAEIGNPNSVTDAGVGALCARSAVLGAFMNVKINAAGLSDKAFVEDILSKGQALADRAVALEKEVIEMVDVKI